MIFTTTPPTTPGFYAWKPSEDGTLVTDYYDAESIMEGFEEGGLWCRLVPAEEVEKAYKEGSSLVNLHPSHINSLWNHSRAKQVAEGKI